MADPAFVFGNPQNENVDGSNKHSTAVVVRNEPNFRQCANAQFPPSIPVHRAVKESGGQSYLNNRAKISSNYPRLLASVSLMIALLIGRPAAPWHLRAAAQDSRLSIAQGQRLRVSRPEWRP